MRRFSIIAALALWCAATTARADMGLVEVWRLAVQHDAKLAQARARFEAQQKQLDRARAALLPQVNLTGSYGRSETDLPADSGDVTTRQIGLGLSQALYNRKALVAYDLAKKQVETARLAWQAAQQDLMTRVVKAYFDVLLAQVNLRQSRALEKANRLQWERATTSEQVGLAARTDVLQARSAWDLARADRIKAESALHTAEENLTRLTGRRLTALRGVATDRPVRLPDLNEQAWLRRALAGNLALRQAALGLEQAQLNVDLARSDYYPTLALTAGVTDTAYDNYNRLLSGVYQDTRAQQVALQLQWNLFAGGLTKATVAQAADSARETAEKLRDAREGTALQVRVLLDRLKEGQALVQALQAAVSSSRAFRDAAEESYRVGLKSLLDVLTARANAYKAERDLTAALNDLVVNQLALEAAAGDLTEDDLRRVDGYLTATGAQGP
ncbi:TolC family outer membrane protein [Sulfurivirga sp.]|uniref:TolC family outer membrane protein n=1 Tax=Sulfurivirga sp. TaxID=2614236 RepID=UPI0025D2BE41|nr:TolC family outer membrane protein [Sulfurivirga sp.]